MRTTIHLAALAAVLSVAATAAAGPPLIAVTGTVYSDAGVAAPGTMVSFTSVTTQTTGGVTVPPTTLKVTADANGAISASLPQGLRVTIRVGNGEPLSVTLPSQSSIDLSDLLAAVQVPPPTTLLSALAIGTGGDFSLSVVNPPARGTATLTPGAVTRLNGSPISAQAPTLGQFLVENGSGSWAPISLAGDIQESTSTLGQLSVVGLAGRALSSQAPTDGQVLLYSASAGKWQPGSGGSGGSGSASGDLSGSYPGPSVVHFTLASSADAGGNAILNVNTLTSSGSGPSISQFNVNGTLNIQAYGAIASTKVISVNTTASSNTLTAPSGIADFKAGQGVEILQGGGAASSTVPANVRLELDSYSPTATDFLAGRLGIVGVMDGSFPTCTVDASNSNCTTSWKVQIVAADTKKGYSAASAPMTIANGPANPSITNEIGVQWDGNTTDVGYLIFMCSDSTNASPANCTPTLRKIVPLMYYNDAHGNPCQGCATPNRQHFMYVGKDDGVEEELGAINFGAVNVPSGALNQALYTTISAISGTTITLAAPAQQTGSFSMLHDNSPAINTAIAAACPTTGNVGADCAPIVIPPPPNGSVYPIGQTINLLRTRGLRIFCQGSIAEPGVFQWHGPAGGTVFNMNQANADVLEGITVTDVTASGGTMGTMPGVGADVDKYDPGDGKGITITTSADEFHNVDFSGAAIGLRIAGRGSSNDELMRLKTFLAGQEWWNNNGGWYGVYIAGGFNTFDEDFYKSNLNNRDVGLFLNNAGSVELYTPNWSHNVADIVINGSLGSPLVENHGDSESASMHLYDEGGWAASGGQVVISNGRYAIQPTAAGNPLTLASDRNYLTWRGGRGLELDSNSFFTGTYTPFNIFLEMAGAQGVATVVSRNNSFDSNVPVYATSSNGTLKADSIGDMCSNPGGLGANGNMGPCYGYASVHGIQVRNIYGAPTVAGLADPSAPTIAVVGGAGSSTCSQYYVVFKDVFGNRTNVSPVSNSLGSTCPASFTSSNYVSITAAPTAGTVAADVLKNDTSHIIGTFTCTYDSQNSSGSQCVFEDIGQASAAYIPPTRNSTGDLTMTSGGIFTSGCAGTVTLSSGSATVNNSCITGSRPVLCTDQTGANPVRCSPSSGSLAVSGSGSDVIAWGQM